MATDNSPDEWTPENPEVMIGPTLQKKVLITNPEGFHMRPVTKFAVVAQKFQSDIFVLKDNQRVNGKSPMEMMLMLSLPGTELTIEVAGPDAERALATLVEIVNAPAEESETPPP